MSPVNSAMNYSDCPSTDSTHQSWKSSEGFAVENSLPRENESPWTRTPLRIPRNDRTVFTRPDLETASELARANRLLLNGSSLTLHGRPLWEFRESARQEILGLAEIYTSLLLGRPVSGNAAGELLFSSGHQPTLFHPGVWIKNFSIQALAQLTNGTALNLVIDNDTLSRRQLRVPTGDRWHPATLQLPFDDPAASGPWEESAIENPDLFESFGQRAVEAMRPWNITPLCSELWPDAVAQAQKSPSLRDAMTSARMKLEHRWGLSNLEVPLSQVCESRSFCWFASAILTRLPRFWETYNTVLAEFRQVNHIRSHTHPVPALVEDDGWYEAPFWVWPAGGQKRHRVLAKACSQEVRLSDGRDVFARLPISSDGDLTAAAEILHQLPELGLRFRTRALTTTLFARLCLADLFVHGIGGAKYDEMTDRLIARFFGLPAPGFLTMSCTVHLPLGEPFPVSSEEEQSLRHQLRDLRLNPERHLPRGIDPGLERLIAEKHSLIAAKSAAKQAGNLDRRGVNRANHDRHQRLLEIRERLSRETAKSQGLLEAELDSVRQQLQANSILEDREFSFALYPEEKLRPFLTELVP